MSTFVQSSYIAQLTVYARQDLASYSVTKRHRADCLLFAASSGHTLLTQFEEEYDLVYQLFKVLFFPKPPNFGTRKAEVLNSLIMNITAKANVTNDILQTFR